MISASKAPATSTSNPAGASTAAASATPAAPFDTILSIETLAATCAALDTGSLEGSCLEGLAEDHDLEDADADAEGPLAFLANLLNFTAVPVQAQAAGDGAADDSIDDVLSGSAKQAGGTDPTALTQAATSNPVIANNTADAAAVAAAQLLVTADKAASSDSDTTRADAKQSTDATTAGMARAAEMLSQGPRHAAGAGRDAIATPVHSPRWADDLGARVALMVRGAESSASLQLTPIDLGPVDISVSVKDSQATIHFGAAQAETRALLEASIPRLREMLAAQGFNLMDASVSQGFTRQARPDIPAPARLDGEPQTEVHTTTRISAAGLLDLYA